MWLESIEFQTNTSMFISVITFASNMSTYSAWCRNNFDKQADFVSMNTTQLTPYSSHPVSTSWSGWQFNRCSQKWKWNQTTIYVCIFCELHDFMVWIFDKLESMVMMLERTAWVSEDQGAPCVFSIIKITYSFIRNTIDILLMRCFPIRVEVRFRAVLKMLRNIWIGLAQLLRFIMFYALKVLSILIELLLNLWSGGGLQSHKTQTLHPNRLGTIQLQWK